MKMTKEQHTHKLKRLRFKSGNTVFFCVLDCPFKISTALVLGKKSICWRCGEPFIMTEYSLRLAKPHCDNCHKPKGAQSIPEITKPLFDEPVKPTTLAEKIQQIMADTNMKTIEEKQPEKDEI